MRWIVMTLVAGSVALAAKWIHHRNKERKFSAGTVSREWIANHRGDRLH